MVEMSAGLARHQLGDPLPGSQRDHGADGCRAVGLILMGLGFGVNACMGKCLHGCSVLGFYSVNMCCADGEQLVQ